jgi:DHA2 family multidrug resistance protein-like MFS transporter
MPSTLALIRTMFPEQRQRAKAIAIWTGVLTGGVALGPVLSGILLEHFWWGSVFLINLPAMIALILLGPVLLPEHREPQAGRFDLSGSVLSLGAILPFAYGIKQWAADGFATVDVVLIGSGVLLGGAFWLRQTTAERPMLDRGLLRHRGFRIGVAHNVVAMFALVGNAVFLTQYLQSVLALSPLTAALWSVAPSVVVAGAAPWATMLARRFGHRSVTAAGFAVGAAGFGVLTTVPGASATDSRAGALAVVLVGAGVLAGGIVVVLTLVTDAALTAIEPARAGSATAVLESGSELGGALGIALLGSIGAAVYRSRIVELLPAHGSPGARRSLTGAVAEARGSGAALDAAREAFTSGLHVACAVGGGVLLVAALGSVARRGAT